MDVITYPRTYPNAASVKEDHDMHGILRFRCRTVVWQMYS